MLKLDCTCFHLQISRSSVKVKVESGGANGDRAEVRRVVIIARVGRLRTSSGSSSDSLEMSVGVGMVDLSHIRWHEHQQQPGCAEEQPCRTCAESLQSDQDHSSDERCA